MQATHGGQILIHLSVGDKDPLRLDAQVRNGILSLSNITCPVHGPTTVLDAIVVERTPDHVTVELQSCCEPCARSGEKAIIQCANS